MEYAHIALDVVLVLAVLSSLGEALWRRIPVAKGDQPLAPEPPPPVATEHVELSLRRAFLFCAIPKHLCEDHYDLQATDKFGLVAQWAAHDLGIELKTVGDLKHALRLILDANNQR